MSKHTPGPWETDANSLSINASDDKGHMRVADIRGWGHLTGRGQGAWGMPPDEAVKIQEANARLIAAAPDMFEALRDIASYYDPSFGDYANTLATKAQKALAKASGEQNRKLTMWPTREKSARNAMEAVATIGAEPACYAEVRAASHFESGEKKMMQNRIYAVEHEPRSESKGHVDFGGYYLTHAIWRNSYGSYQPETGVRTHAGGLKDFRLIQHNSDDWPMVTVVALAGLSKGWDTERIGELIEWLHNRSRRKKTRARFAKMHTDLVAALQH